MARRRFHDATDCFPRSRFELQRAALLARASGYGRRLRQRTAMANAVACERQWEMLIKTSRMPNSWQAASAPPDSSIRGWPP